MNKNSFIKINLKNEFRLVLNKLRLKEKNNSNYLKKFKSCNNSEVSEKLSKFREIKSFDFDFSILQCAPEMVYINFK